MVGHQKQSGIAWLKLEGDKKICQHPAHSAKKKTAVKGRVIITIMIYQKLQAFLSQSMTRIAYVQNTLQMKEQKNKPVQI